jgi:hypothetical protein
MGNGLLFFGLVLVLAIFVVVASKTMPTKEGFQPIVIPTPGPPAQPINAGAKAMPYTEPSTQILSAPIGQTSDVTSRPFQDPALDKSKYVILYALLQDMHGFKAFELENLEDTSDPSISLPLNTFRGDLQRLEDEVAFLNRNPGIDTTLTVEDVYEIRVNLTYLQKKARYMNTGAIEGFEDATVSPKATLDDLKDTNTKISVEIARLQASGTTDPSFQARVNILVKIQQQIGNYITQLQNNTLQPADVPITKEDLKKFLPQISNPSSPVTKFLNSIQAPSSVSNLFPAYVGGDISGAALANVLLQNYGKGLSWDINMKYSAPGGSSLNATTNVPGGQGQQFQLGSPQLQMPPSTRGAFDQAIAQIQKGDSNQRFAQGETSGVRPTLPEPPTQQFNWKERSSQICESVRLRGLDPADFGCLTNVSKIGQDFSWRGYAKMVCNRLKTTLDEGLPETCGCPPVDWPGWKQ